MARIPTQEELGGVQYSAVRSQPQFRSNDYAADAQAGRALAQAGEAVQGVVAKVVAKKEKDDEYEIQSRLNDFDLEQEKRLDDMKRSARPEASDFTREYRTGYDEGARKFMESVPDHYKQKMDLLLNQRGNAFEKRAYDFELKERDRYHTEDVNKKLTNLYNDTTTTPDRRFDNGQRGVALLRSSRLPINTRLRMEREFLERNDEYAARSALETAKSPEERELILDQLKRMPKSGASSQEDANKRIAGARFSPQIEGAIDNAAKEAGIDGSWLRAFAQIESGGDPGARTGSYKGLLQLSDSEFKKHGGSGNIYDPMENARVGAIKLKAEMEEFQSRYGRAPQPYELYLVHQQGVGGFQNHQANPGAPAWENMANTAEGRQKGEAWAKRAIWGNIPNAQKAQFGSVDNVTSQQFMELWQSRVERGMGGGYIPPEKVAAGDRPEPMHDANDEPVEHDQPVFQHLSPVNRRKLLNVGRNMVRADMVGVVDGAVERIRRGEQLERDDNGQTVFDRSVRHLAPQQRREAESKMETALLYSDAVRGAHDETTDKIDDRIAQLADTSGIDEAAIPARRRALQEALTLRNRLETMRQKDGAAAVMGDQKARIAPSKEVIEATDKIDKLDKTDKVAYDRARRQIMIDARVAAQMRTNPDREPRLLTKEEINTLLPMPYNTKMGNPDFVTAIEKATDKAYRQFGPELGRKVLTEAIRYKITGDNETIAAPGMMANAMAKLSRGLPLTQEDVARMRMEHASEFRFGGDVESQPGGRYGVSEPSRSWFTSIFGGGAKPDAGQTSPSSPATAIPPAASAPAQTAPQGAQNGAQSKQGAQAQGKASPAQKAPVKPANPFDEDD